VIRIDFDGEIHRQLIVLQLIKRTVLVRCTVYAGWARRLPVSSSTGHWPAWSESKALLFYFAPVCFGELFKIVKTLSIVVKYYSQSTLWGLSIGLNFVIYVGLVYFLFRWSGTKKRTKAPATFLVTRYFVKFQFQVFNRFAAYRDKKVVHFSFLNKPLMIDVALAFTSSFAFLGLPL
jgi:hypothetical protein